MGNLEDNKPECIIRKAVVADTANIQQLIQEHLKDSVYSNLNVNSDKLSNIILSMINIDPTKGYLIVAYDENIMVGLICCVAVPLMFTNDMVSGELIWLVKKEYRGSNLGKRLLMLLEEWSVRTQHVLVQVGSNDAKTDKLLNALGYKEKSRTFMKELNGR